MLKTILRSAIQKHKFYHLVRMAPFSSSAAPSTSSGADSEVLFDEHGSRRVITLNRPKQLNATNLNMIRKIHQKMQIWDADPNVDCVITKGAGGKAFCAGGDATVVAKSGKDTLTGGTEHLYKKIFWEEYELYYLIDTLPMPHVALADGILMGGGSGLSVIGEFCVVTERTLYSMPETALGHFPDVGAGHFLSHLKSNIGMYLGLCSARINGADCYHIGLATHYAESSSIPKIEEALLNSKEKLNSRNVDKILKSFQPKEIPLFSLQKHVERIENCFGGSSVEEIISRLQNDGSEWAKQVLEGMKKLSPTSMKITHKQLTLCKNLDYRQTLMLEYPITQRISLSHDLHEGVRAILIDKDRNPKWQPSRLSQVSQEMVDAYFAPLPKEDQFYLPERKRPSKL